MTKDEAVELLLAEVVRLRSGAGGYGGRSPEAIRLAWAISTVLARLGVGGGAGSDPGGREGA